MVFVMASLDGKLNDHRGHRQPLKNAMEILKTSMN